MTLLIHWFFFFFFFFFVYSFVDVNIIYMACIEMVG
jgi:hypothetical protein